MKDELALAASTARTSGHGPRVRATDDHERVDGAAHSEGHTCKKQPEIRAAVGVGGDALQVAGIVSDAMEQKI